MTVPIVPTSAPQSDRPIPPPMFGALRIAATGLSAQSFRMQIIAQNMANAETTRTPEGGPYNRRVALLAAEPATPSPLGNAASTADPAATVGGAAGANAGADAGVATGGSIEAGDLTGGVRIAGIGVDSSSPHPLVYDPGNPDADKSGYVRLPNVDLNDELMDLMSARRLYDANATVFEVAKAMLHQATSI